MDDMKQQKQSGSQNSEAGTIVALTAHTMSSDEAKCLEVGMDAYLTEPIDYKFMVSTKVLEFRQRIRDKDNVVPTPRRILLAVSIYPDMVFLGTTIHN
ncbi:hypothetical protein V6N13_070662 [Hibiscus sabdariffa]